MRSNLKDYVRKFSDDLINSVSDSKVQFLNLVLLVADQWTGLVAAHNSENCLYSPVSPFDIGHKSCMLVSPEEQDQGGCK